MSTKSNEPQNVWFGVSMFLVGLIVGVILAAISGNITIGQNDKVPSPSAPSAPVAEAPKANVNDRMIAYAADVGITKKDFEACVAENTEAFTAKANKETAEGQAAGVNGTPGNILYDLRSKKARVISGAQPAANFEKHINAMLADQNAEVTDQSAVNAGTVVPVNFDTDHYKGSKNAKIAIIEYSDYECPFCHRVHPTIQSLVDKYDGDVVWIYRHFPLGFHPEALPLAIGAECVAKLKGNDAFWKFTDAEMSK